MGLSNCYGQFVLPTAPEGVDAIACLQERGLGARNTEQLERKVAKQD